MYQLEFENGYKIHVVGKGEDALGWVYNDDSRLIYHGSYSECEKWLNELEVRKL